MSSSEAIETSVDNNIPKGWHKTTLGKLVTFHRGYDLPRKDMVEGQFPVIGSNGIIGYHNHFKTKALGVTVGRSGNLGKPFLVEKDYWPHNTTLYVSKFHSSDPYFVYYFLKTLNLSRFNAGSAVPTLNRNHIHPINIIIPKELEEQRAIGKTISYFDSKIQLNHEMNRTLEAVGKAVFRSWFVNFEFPDEEGKPYRSSGGKMVDSEIGKIPKGWKLGNFGSIIEEVNERARDISINYEVLSAIKTGNLISSEDYFKKRVHSKNLSKYKRVRLYDFAYNPSRINIGSIGMLDKKVEGIVSPVYVVFKPRSGYHYFILYSLRIGRIKQRIIQFCSGTVRQNLNFQAFSKIELVIPPKYLLKLFNEKYEKIAKLIDFNSLQINTIEKIRDLLLPKLMSGKIRVPFVEGNVGFCDV